MAILFLLLLPNKKGVGNIFIEKRNNMTLIKKRI